MFPFAYLWDIDYILTLWPQNTPLWIKTVYFQSCVSLIVVSFWPQKNHMTVSHNSITIPRVFVDLKKKKKWGCILNSVMYKHQTVEIALSWEIRDCSFSFTSNELCFVLLGKSTSLLVCDAQEPSLCSRLWLLFLSSCKPGVIAPVGNPFKVLRTPALETALAL